MMDYIQAACCIGGTLAVFALGGILGVGLTHACHAREEVKFNEALERFNRPDR